MACPLLFHFSAPLKLEAEFRPFECKILQKNNLFFDVVVVEQFFNYYFFSVTKKNIYLKYQARLKDFV